VVPTARAFSDSKHYSDKCVCWLQLADLHNDSVSAHDSWASKLPSNDSTLAAETIDINSNALVEPNRENSSKRLVDSGDDGPLLSPPVKSASSQSTSLATSSSDAELSSISHMLDVASSTNICTLLAPSVTPPKRTVVAFTSEKPTMPDDTAAIEAAESVAEAVARDVQRNKVRSLYELLTFGEFVYTVSHKKGYYFSLMELSEYKVISLKSLLLIYRICD